MFLISYFKQIHCNKYKNKSRCHILYYNAECCSGAQAMVPKCFENILFIKPNTWSVGFDKK